MRCADSEDGNVAETSGASELPSDSELFLLAHELGERIKELNCLYAISRLAQRPGTSLDEILSATVDLVPSAWQYPDVACARLTWNGRTYQTDNFQESRWVQKADIVIRGARVGLIEVRYVEERPDCGEGPFLKEEASLIAAIAEHLERIIEKRLAEESLRESEERFRIVAEKTGQLFYDYDVRSGVIRWDGAITTVTGFSPEEFARNDIAGWESLIHPDDRDSVLTQLYEAVHQGKEFDVVYRFRRRDGAYIYVEDRGICLSDGSDDVTRMLGTMSDVTDRMRAEEALRSSLRLSQVAGAHTVETLIEYGLEEGVRLTESEIGYFHFINPDQRTIALKSWSRKTMESCAVGERDSHYPVDKAGVWVDCIRERRAVIHNDYANLSHKKGLPDGHVPVARDLAVPVFEGDRIVAVIGVGNKRQDYNELDVAQLSLIAEAMWVCVKQKRAEESLRQERDKAQKYLDVAGVIFMVIDPLQRVAQINRKGCEILGCSETDITGSNWFDTFLPEDAREWVRQAFSRALSGDGAAFERIECPAVTRDGDIRTIAWHNILLRDERGGVVGALCSGEDITERRQMEEELFKAKQYESLSILAGGIAHDFNNLLQSLLGSISAAKMQLDPGHKAYAYLDLAKEAYTVTRNLTNQLFTFARGGEPLKGLVCVEDLVRDSVRFALSGSDVKFQFHAPGGCAAVEIDEGQIRRVIHNIVINAKEAMLHGGTLRVRVDERHINGSEGFLVNEGRYARISFTDDGVGIPREDLTRVFEPYYSTKTTWAQKGMGLGLAISYSVVRRHGGHITVESERGKGTTFEIYLPIAEAAIAEKGGKYEIPQGPLKGLRVLVMDDEPTIADAVRACLGHSGCEVEVTSEGADALRRYREARRTGRPFDVVILDLTVAGSMGGREVLERLREIDPAVKAIITSGYPDDPVVVDYRDYGFSGVLLKPYETEQLKLLVSSVVETPIP
jgi:PAS domain S-box-containing protein